MGFCLITTIVLMVFAGLRCTDIFDVAKTQAKITVFVHWNDTPISQKKVELLQTGEVRLTNEKGLAEFTVLPGHYTIRVYGINRGGPAVLYVDFNVDMQASESRMLDVVDCLPCV